MTTNASAPTAATELPYADGDFFGFESLLPAHELDRLNVIRDWVEAEVRPIAQDHWNRSEFPVHLIPKIAELDMISPVRRQGYSHLLAGMITAAIHRVDASFGTFFSGHDGLFTGSIELLASEEQKAAWLPDIYALKKTGVFAITEPLAGSDVAGGTQTTAVRDGDNWILNGEKRWIGNSTFSDYVLVWAKDVADDQVKGFLVETKTPGFSATLMENRIALRAVQNADIVLDNVVVPDFFKLANANSFRDTNKVLKSTRATVGWQAVGLQMAAFDVARKHAVERLQFGKPIASFQLIQEQLVTILSNAQASMGMMVRLAQMEDEGTSRNEHSALAKAFVTKCMRESVALGRSILGGNGLQVDYEIGKIFCDAEAIYTYEGTYEINTLVAGRAITGVAAFV
ncbi:acyl-CoA dehydrogenase family protein [Glutamicibacter protophormiae]|uniref:acyl-CoA dehydrogenase family protein n=1 Tax=Glutamicibacter protophormiae TaxID=37930 RepID=UPI002A7FFE9A|nr:acyl-CoA dehydrogenase family protein [Glutamicibacter protophormiae]WPR65641.1 acyl-CoA dehydrogenase family protein [Glutamicibacter protophormiae]WPR69138.1 acyl-CoA dehydrogenase family protein [Glutamicibacter protophormiae]